ncbi:hypothetical protein LARV_00932 [Longilinea arvoryzae]|uniref:Uncharacterized protein n=1 Tax=Longilinea arvoryzae TaxID=360412 RepID=A0A0S7BCW4_9CHLR|nr:hypothetical protein [Longilinea arvoryzae]GAP13181.1 hypothetical protein LARV_00932 [Longilinea arvoryzae]
MSRRNQQQASGHSGMGSTIMDLRNRGDEKQYRENLILLNDRGSKNAEQAWKRQRLILVVSTSLLGLILVGLVLLLFSVRQVSNDFHVFINRINTPQPVVTTPAVEEEVQPTSLPPTDIVTPEPEIKVEWSAPTNEYFVNLSTSLEVTVKQGEQGKTGVNVSVSVDNSTGLELTATNFSTDTSGKAIISFIPRQPGDYILTATVGDQSQRLLVHVNILDSDEDGVSDDQEELWGSDPFINNIFSVKAPNGLKIRSFSSPDLQLALLPDNMEVFFIPDKQSSNPQFSWLFIKLSYEAGLMDIENRLAKGAELSIFSQEDKKITLYRQIECRPAESFDYSQLDLLDCLIVQPENGKYVIWLFGAASPEFLASVNQVLTTGVPAVTTIPPVSTPGPTATTFIMMENTPEPTAGNIVPVP